MLAGLARGEPDAFAALYDRLAASVYGLVRRVVRDPAQSQEVTQEVLLEVWRTAPRFDASRGSAVTWIMTMAHRRAVDRVRSEQAPPATAPSGPGPMRRPPNTTSWPKRWRCAWSTSTSVAPSPA